MPRGGARPNSGRKRKEPALKQLAGTERADRENEVGTPASTGAMICPLHLSDLAQLHFESLAKILEEQDRASPHYAEHVALLAQRLEQIQRYQAVIEVEGDTFTSESAKKIGNQLVVTRMVRARPEVAMLSEAMRHAQSLIAELMLNPAAALRIASGHKPEAGAFDEF
ncbi:P27 family phage terminase small subunit [Erythrobacter litoralis]|uniref:P27 family phage terminase small subunit n=1 Tax=Erythrobacter litoralis TaxID=39960 RepID=UPI002434BAF3|nr:P27 family phage terminase small subunit [Erythrobacter litoralis]MDG6079763.1 P27 family phage terminase small subunit [Erythrobacter litoralis]